MSRKTYFGLVREYFPDATDKECDYILWEKTEFPFVKSEVNLRKQLQDYKDKSTK
jgi:hypothetical protein